MAIRRARAVLPAAIFAVSVAACGGSAPTTVPSGAAPSATAEHTPAPSIDVSAAFRTAFLAIDSGVMTLSGTATVGNVRVTVSGTQTSSGPDSSSTTTTTIGGVGATVEKVTVGGVRFVRGQGGPWLADTSPAPASDLNKELERIVGLVVASGTESRAGQTLTKLVPPPGTTIDPAALGLASSGVTKATSSLAFYAKDDGTPVAVSVSLAWTQAAGNATVEATMDVDIEFSQLGVAQTIRAPSDVWSLTTSTRYAYRVAAPASWDFDQSDKHYDYLFSAGDTFGAVTREKLPSGATLNLVAKSETASMKTELKVKSVANEAATLGGEKARMLSGSGVLSGKKVTIFETIAIHQGYIYYLAWFSPAGNEAADLETYRQMASTFGFN